MPIPKHHKVSMFTWKEGVLSMSHFYLQSLTEALKFARELHISHGKHVKIYDPEGQIIDNIGPEIQATYA